MTGGVGLLCQSDLAFPFGDTATAGQWLALISALTSYAGVFAGPTQVFPLAHLLTLVSFPVTRGSAIFSGLHADAFTPRPVFVPEPSAVAFHRARFERPLVYLCSPSQFLLLSSMRPA